MRLCWQIWLRRRGAALPMCYMGEKWDGAAGFNKVFGVAGVSKVFDLAV